MRISDWMSDVCSSDLAAGRELALVLAFALGEVEAGEPPFREQGAHRLDLEHAAGRPIRPFGIVPEIVVAQRIALGGAIEIGDRKPEFGRASCWERVCQYL